MIFAFAEKMADLLYRLDTKEIVMSAYKGAEDFSADDFLYSRCAALINGKTYYNAVVNKRRKLKIDMEFETILYAPMYAWARLHGKSVEEYSYVTEVSYESGSNTEGWVTSES